MNLYDTFEQFDDILHFANWTFLVAALVLFVAPQGLARWNLVLLGSGFGAIAIIAWEAVEWVVQEMGTTLETRATGWKRLAGVRPPNP